LLSEQNIELQEQVAALEAKLAQRDEELHFYTALNLEFEGKLQDKSQEIGRLLEVEKQNEKLAQVLKSNVH